MGMAVFPHKIGLSGVQINAVDSEVLLSKGSDDLLDADAGIVKLQAFLQNIVNILYIDKYVLPLLPGRYVRNDLHQVPAVLLPAVSAVAAAQYLMVTVKNGFHVLQAGKGNKAIHILGMNAAVINKAPKPA